MITSRTDGDAEEAREVDAHAAAVDPPADGDGHEHAETAPRPAASGLDRRSRPGRRRAGTSRSRGPRAGRRGRPWRRGAMAEPAASAPAAWSRSSPLEVARVAAHADDHVGDHRDGDEADDGLEGLLLALGQLVVDDPSTTATATHSATASPTPTHIQRSASRRPWRRRKAAMIPTMSAASRPSRRAMTKWTSGSTEVRRGASGRR